MAGTGLTDYWAVLAIVLNNQVPRGSFFYNLIRFTDSFLLFKNCHEEPDTKPTEVNS